MPVGKPGDGPGEVVSSGRHYRGGHGNLGTASVWKCPACGQQQTSRIELGCPQCGAGKPGEAKVSPDAVTQPRTPPKSPRPAQPAEGGGRNTPRELSTSAPNPARTVSAGTARVVRVIEYLVKPGMEEIFRDVLRRSLVGSVELRWGSMTAAIVDSVDSRQEDLLRMAKFQPGVWFNSPSILEEPGGVQGVLERMLQRPNKPAVPPPGMQPLSVRGQEIAEEIKQYGVRNMAVPDDPDDPPPAAADEQDPPDIGRTPPAEMVEIAAAWAKQFGYRFVHTMALALQGIAEELRANSEPDKFLTTEECLDFAQALINVIPDEWDGDPVMETETNA